GRCTTDSTGACAPPGNDTSSAYLAGRYQVIETSGPPGYALDPSSERQTVQLAPGAVSKLTFDDPLLVAATFHKVATGNVDPASVLLSGATIDVTQDAPPIPTRLGRSRGRYILLATSGDVATCTTGASGTCTTAPAFESGRRYCWTESTAPAGLVGGANG